MSLPDPSGPVSFSRLVWSGSSRSHLEGPVSEQISITSDSSILGPSWLTHKFKGPSSFVPVSDLLRCDSSLSLLYYGIFFFPFSLHVNCLLGFGRGDYTAQSSLLAGSSSDWSFRVSLSFSLLCRNEIGFSIRVLISSSSFYSSRIMSGSLISSSVIGWLELSGVRVGKEYHDVDSSNLTSQLTRTSFVRGL